MTPEPAPDRVPGVVGEGTVPSPEAYDLLLSVAGELGRTEVADGLLDGRWLARCVHGPDAGECSEA